MCNEGTKSECGGGPQVHLQVGGSAEQTGSNIHTLCTRRGMSRCEVRDSRAVHESGALHDTVAARGRWQLASLESRRVAAATMAASATRAPL